MTDNSQSDKHGDKTPRTDAVWNNTPNDDLARDLFRLSSQLERELAEAKDVQIHKVEGPDGGAVAAPCQISGCQLAARPSLAAPVAWIGRRLTASGEIDHETVKNGTMWLKEMGYTDTEIHPLYEAPLSPLAEKDAPHRDWHWAAYCVGERLGTTGPRNYYEFTPDQWLAWALSVLSHTEPSVSSKEWQALVEAAREEGRIAGRNEAHTEQPINEVWCVANRTSSVLFESQEMARAYVSRFGAATGGGMSITNLQVVRSPTTARSTPAAQMVRVEPLPPQPETVTTTTHDDGPLGAPLLWHSPPVGTPPSSSVARMVPQEIEAVCALAKRVEEFDEPPTLDKCLIFGTAIIRLREILDVWVQHRDAFAVSATVTPIADPLIISRKLHDEYEAGVLLLQKDALRYRWLRQDNGERKPFVGRWDGHAFSRWTNEHADEAIDAAMDVGAAGRKA